METPSRHSFNLDGSTRVFPIPSPIKGDNYCRLEVDGTVINDRAKYDIVNNSVVFIDVADVPSGSQLDVLVVQSEEALGQLTITTNIDIVAQDIDNVNAVGSSIDNVDTVAASITNVNTTATNIANVNTVAGISANVTTVANNNANVTTVAGIDSDVTTVAGNNTNVTTVATNIASVNTVATNIADVITVANDLNEAISEIETAANDLNEAVSEIDTVAVNIDNVNTVGTNIANVNTVAGIDANVTTVAGISANVTTVAGNNTNVTKVANIDADVTKVANIDTDVTTVADNISDVTNFADVYLGGKASDPATRNDSSALQAGDLYFNTSVSELRTYSGSQWVSGTAGTMAVQRFTGDGATASFTLSQAPSGENNTQVYINGIYQQKDSYSVSGTSLILSEAPEADQVVEVVTISTLALGETAASLVSITDSGDYFTSGTVEGALQEAVEFTASGTGAVTRTVDNKLNDFVSVKDFGAVGDGVTDDTAAIQAASDAAHTGDTQNFTLYFPAGVYRTTATVNLRQVSVSAVEAHIEGDHTGIVLEIGGRAQSGNNPKQDIGTVTRTQGVDDRTTPTVRATGVKDQEITLQRTVYFQMWADGDDSNYSGSSAYSRITLKYVTTLDIYSNPSSGTIGWINENWFYLHRISQLLVDGNYNHNHNWFIGGNFEGSNATIQFDRGFNNKVRGIRGEGFDGNITFSTYAESNAVEFSWYSSGRRFRNLGDNAIVTDNNGSNAVYNFNNLIRPFKPIASFMYDKVFDLADGTHGFKGLINVTINADSFSAGSWRDIYQSHFITADAHLYMARLAERSSGGTRLIVEGYDDTYTAIASTGADIYYDGVGSKGFGEVDASVTTGSGRWFWITNPDCKYIKIRLYTASAGVIAKGFVVGRIDASVDSTVLAQTY